ncbi:S10 family peptidase [Methylocapsa palsarum]|uniref:Carboxypeptidase C (Cathepsin A) n=1 Tax=Methylocapsa palsarum TaxID=1612308 RepID=A0A1I3XYX1_9HYPH|nr:peptidase S10 [Methylocapsa palsarum]SFK24186.1 Carboxypeptidase C (cathepsin A) [Methylocapsa palsarum]
MASMSSTLATALCLCCIAVGASAEAPDAATTVRPAPPEAAQPAPTAPPNPLPAPVTTSHAINPPGRALRFKAIAGAIRLSEAQTGAPLADVAYVAFVLDGGDAAKRPVTFAINGGPGASSAWLNLGAMGPWRLPLEAAPASPSAPAALIENADTWLDFTDLVFIDPPGTGYSRILAKGDEARRQLYSVSGDIDALAVAIRKWITANNRLSSPKFIVGESYGGFRGPKLARRLQDGEGVGIRGLVLISPVLDFSWFESANNPLTYVTRLPSQAAAVRKLDATDGRSALADVEAYAEGPYLLDLLRGERDPAALARMSEKVAGFTGLDPAFVRRLGGRLDSASFARERGRDEGKIASAYDARVSGFDPQPHAASSDYSDPVLDAVKTPLASAMADLTARRLNWPIEARYEILNESVAPQWEWGGHGRSRSEALTDLKRAMAIDPQLRVLIVHGATDEVTPYFASKLLIDQVPTFGDPDRLRLRVYGGGHMVYFQDKSRAALREDAKNLIEGR